MPLKCSVSVAPPSRRWSPPRPEIDVPGAARRISLARAPAYRSPDGSPHEIITRTRGGSTLEGEEGRVEWHVVLDGTNGPLQRDDAADANRRPERHLDAADIAVVRERLFRLGRRRSRRADRLVPLPDGQSGHRI